MTFGLWLADLAKGVAVAVVLGLPLLVLVLWLMRVAGTLWWLWAWGAWMAFQLLVLVLYPTLIAPLFNKFTPMDESPARDSASRRCSPAADSSAAGLFVMDGSKRSGHGNAYFTGFGKAKRIVFFDTLLARLAPEEIEAVLAHELGHYKLKHVAKRIVWSAALSLAILALLAFLAREPWFYAGLGIPEADAPRRFRSSGYCARVVPAGLAGVHVHARAVVVAVFAPPRIRGRRVRHAACIGRGADAGAGQAVRGQRGHADARSASFGVLRFASARRDPDRAYRGARGHRERWRSPHEASRLRDSYGDAGGGSARRAARARAAAESSRPRRRRGRQDARRQGLRRLPRTPLWRCGDDLHARGSQGAHRLAVARPGAALQRRAEGRLFSRGRGTRGGVSEPYVLQVQDEPAGPPQGRIPERAARRQPYPPAGPPQGRIPQRAARRQPYPPAGSAPRANTRSAQREGNLIRPPGRPKGEYRSAQREGNLIRPPGRPKGEYRSAQREGTP